MAMSPSDRCGSSASPAKAAVASAAGRRAASPNRSSPSLEQGGAEAERDRQRAGPGPVLRRCRAGGASVLVGRRAADQIARSSCARRRPSTAAGRPEVGSRRPVSRSSAAKWSRSCAGSADARLMGAVEVHVPPAGAAAPVRPRWRRPDADRRRPTGRRAAGHPEHAPAGDPAGAADTAVTAVTPRR